MEAGEEKGGEERREGRRREGRREERGGKRKSGRRRRTQKVTGVCSSIVRGLTIWATPLCSYFPIYSS